MTTKYYRTVLRVEVLSASPSPSSADLERIAHNITEGGWSGVVECESQEAVSEEAMRALLEGQGSDPEFVEVLS